MENRYQYRNGNGEIAGYMASTSKAIGHIKVGVQEMTIQLVNHATGNTHTGPDMHNGSIDDKNKGGCGPNNPDGTPFASVTDAVEFAQKSKMGHFSVIDDSGNLAYKITNGVVDVDATKPSKKRGD